MPRSRQKHLQSQIQRPSTHVEDRRPLDAAGIRTTRSHGRGRLQAKSPAGSIAGIVLAGGLSRQLTQSLRWPIPDRRRRQHPGPGPSRCGSSIDPRSERLVADALPYHSRNRCGSVRLSLFNVVGPSWADDTMVNTKGKSPRCCRAPPRSIAYVRRRCSFRIMIALPARHSTVRQYKIGDRALVPPGTTLGQVTRDMEREGTVA